MKHLFQKLNTLKVLAYFFGEPYVETHLREIARKAKMNPATVKRSLDIIERFNLVSKRKSGNACYYKANMTPFFKHLKISHTLGMIEAQGIADIISLHCGGLSSILLYGSCARGEDDGSSDYDFLVIAARCDVKSRDLGAKLGRECSVQSYSISEWKELSRKNRAFYLEAISSSIALKGDKPVID